MMLTRGFFDLFGIMARPANQRVQARDLSKFSDWLHVILDPVMVKVFAGGIEAQRMAFRKSMIQELQLVHGFTLTSSTDSSTLIQNQVNLSISVMSNALHTLGAKLYPVSFYGMKWAIRHAEPVLDRFIYQYRARVIHA